MTQPDLAQYLDEEIARGHMSAWGWHGWNRLKQKNTPLKGLHCLVQ